VADASGAAVAGADVELYLAGGKRPLLAVKTSSDGTFNFIAVRPADYDLTADAKGFLKATVRNITVDAARETPVPQVKLQLPAVSQTVEVTAEVEAWIPRPPKSPASSVPMRCGACRSWTVTHW
jgi:hypothetical protein